jgi:hypothetical protein
VHLHGALAELLNSSDKCRTLQKFISRLSFSSTDLFSPFLLEDKLRTAQVLAAITAALFVTVSAPALAQKKGAEKEEKKSAAPATPVVRYFASLNDIGDAVLKETRSGKTLTAATLDLCFPTDVDSPIKDRVVIDLSVTGQTLTGSGETTQRKLPVTVKLTRSVADDKFKFEGEVKIGTDVESVTSEDNEDVSEADYKTGTSDDASRLQPSPTAFTEVSPDSLRIRTKVQNATDVLKAAQAENVAMWVTGLLTECDELRTGEITIDLIVDPARAAAVLAKLQAIPGVITAGYTSSIFDMDRAVRFAAADWMTDGKIDRNKLSQSISTGLEKSLSAKVSSAVWNDTTGHLTLDLKRPSVLHPALKLTETLTYEILVGFDAPTSTTDLVLWLSSPEGKTTDDAAGSKITINNPAGGEQGGLTINEGDDVVKDVQTTFKAMRWDGETSKWVP